MLASSIVMSRPLAGPDRMSRRSKGGTSDSSRERFADSAAWVAAECSRPFGRAAEEELLPACGASAGCASPRSADCRQTLPQLQTDIATIAETMLEPVIESIRGKHHHAMKPPLLWDG